MLFFGISDTSLGLLNLVGAVIMALARNKFYLLNLIVGILLMLLGAYCLYRFRFGSGKEGTLPAGVH